MYKYEERAKFLSLRGFGGGGFGAGASGMGQPPFQVETEHDTTAPGGATKFSYHSITKMAAYQVWAERTSLFTPSPSATHSVNPRDRTRHRTKHRARAHSLTPAP